jgi:predicted transcriptional regulator
MKIPPVAALSLSLGLRPVWTGRRLRYPRVRCSLGRTPESGKTMNSYLPPSPKSGGGAQFVLPGGDPPPSRLHPMGGAPWLWLRMWLVILALGGWPWSKAAAFPAVGQVAPPFAVYSGSDEKLTLDMLRGKVIVLFYESRQVIRKNIELKNELKKLYQAQPDWIKDRIFRLVVIDCSEASWATRPLWKKRLREHSKKEGFSIYGDWSGRMLTSYGLQREESNFLILDKDGVIRYSTFGKIERGQFEEIKKLLFSLVREG